ncbi:hypothetical protein [Methanimicrococcus blatticola]|uniref:hypothetical protein n=1 Tax=Methanimicrococcus blatticola TaxID=91560 RepID=UPI00105C6AFA|nr:hypothetical protein [Methanimicrococcus blatticola]MBZ3936046.1 hypothetical protein [Methanimicrococcus blatticola]MCC2509342.1 hypothetical protein [Methanimicrococcus blatticola]
MLCVSACCVYQLAACICCFLAHPFAYANGTAVTYCLHCSLLPLLLTLISLTAQTRRARTADA